jgi:RNA polymerase sigma-70 factor (ECF subfamily)
VEDFRDGLEFERGLVAAYPGLLRYAEALSGSRAEAWDLVHETLERGLLNRVQFQHGDTPKAWLTTILRRIFVDRCRHARVAARLSRQWGREDDFDQDEESPASLWERFSIEDVRRALLFVAPSFRVPFAMLAFDHLSYREIGRRLSLSPGTVASRVFRARQRLREILVTGEFRLRAIEKPSGGPSAPPSSGPGVAVDPVVTQTALRLRRRARNGRSAPPSVAAAVSG